MAERRSVMVGGSRVRLGRTRKNRAGGRSGGRSIGFRGFKSMKVRGLNALERRLMRYSKIGDVDAVLKAESSSGMLTGAKTRKLISRSAWENARIWRQHRKNGRDPFVYDERKGTAMWADAAGKALEGDDLVKAAVEVARYMRTTAVDNVRNEKNMKALAPRYAQWKNKYHHGKPILVLTGQLLKALVPHAVRIT